MTQAICVWRNPVHRAYKKTYSPFTNAEGNYTYRHYEPTPSSRNRIARLARSKEFEVYRAKTYFVIMRRLDSAEGDR